MALFCRVKLMGGYDVKKPAWGSRPEIELEGEGEAREPFAARLQLGRKREPVFNSPGF
ncbi:MAG: hypothetical protein Sw2PiBPW_25100 [Shewanella algae]